LRIIGKIIAFSLWVTFFADTTWVRITGITFFTLALYADVTPAISIADALHAFTAAIAFSTITIVSASAAILGVVFRITTVGAFVVATVLAGKSASLIRTGSSGIGGLIANLAAFAAVRYVISNIYAAWIA
jgi:hypothetical protein